MSDLDASAGIQGRGMLDDPIVVWRDDGGSLHAMEDRCPHRHAPLSLGRVEGDRLRCMYHGMLLDTSGACVGMPLMSRPPDAGIRCFPVLEENSCIWVWMGDPDRADPGTGPNAFGLDDRDAPQQHRV